MLGVGGGNIDNIQTLMRKKKMHLDPAEVLNDHTSVCKYEYLQFALVKHKINWTYGRKQLVEFLQKK